MPKICNNQRIEWIDIAKGIGILSIILMHCQPPKYLGILLASYSVQLFFFLSGCCFSLKQESFNSFVLHKVNRLLVPYYFLGTIIVVYRTMIDCVLKHESVYILMDYEKKLLISKSFTSLWYLPCLFVSSVLFWLLLKTTKNQLAYSGVVSFMLMILSYMYYRLGGKTLPWNIDVALVAIFYLWMGYSFHKLTKDKQSENILVIFITYLVFQLEISGKYSNELHFSNIELIIKTSLVFHLEISGNFFNVLQP